MTFSREPSASAGLALARGSRLNSYLLDNHPFPCLLTLAGYPLSRNLTMSAPALFRSDIVEQRSGLIFGGVALLLMVSAATLAAAVPLQFSIATVFLFAGPHNWIEARYFLARTPARW